MSYTIVKMPLMDYTKVERLIAIKESNGWSGRRMARELRVQPSTWSRWERGLHKPGEVSNVKINNRFPELREKTPSAQLSVSSETHQNQNPASPFSYLIVLYHWIKNLTIGCK